LERSDELIGVCGGVCVDPRGVTERGWDDVLGAHGGGDLDEEVGHVFAVGALEAEGLEVGEDLFVFVFWGRDGWEGGGDECLCVYVCIFF
jgi:hypothetical protein